MRYLHGEDKLKDFLALYAAGTPPLLVSNGFPGDFLPRPLTTHSAIDRNLPVNIQREQFREHKEAKANKWLTVAEFSRVLNGEPHVPSRRNKPAEEKRVTLKNQLNRLTSTTGEGGALYNFEEYYSPEITIYLKVADDFIGMANQLFQYIADTGYGKRKSIGYGQLELVSFKPPNEFICPEKPNGFVTLSNFVPSANDPTEGFWNLIVKYGKMGEEWASEDHAFKKPLLMLEAGSTFFDSPPRDYYGCLVKNLNPAYHQVVQYAFALPVPMIIGGQ
jgi:CRISPR-associated protein Csm4